MLSVDKVEKTILKVAGNPDSGPVRALARTMAEAIVESDGEDRTNPPHQQRKEKRVTKLPEIR